MRRFALIIITLILLFSAAMRLHDITRLPPGFSPDEVKDILIARTIQQGNIASFYNVGDPNGGHEGLYPLIEALVTGVLGDGILNYRILSVWCGLISVALTYALTRRLFGHFAGAVAAATFSMMFFSVVLSRSAIRETLLMPLSLAFLWMIAVAFHIRREIHADPPETVSFTALGVLMAAMAYTHWTGLMALPILLMVFVFLVVNRIPISRRVLSYLAFSVIVALILGIPYLTFTIRAFDLSGFNTYLQNLPHSAVEFFNSVFRTAGSLFLNGDLSPKHNFADFPLLGIFSIAIVLLGLITVALKPRTPSHALILIALVAGLAPSAIHRQAPDFTHMILAIGPLMALAGLGTQFLAEQLTQRNPLVDFRIMAVGLLVFSVSAILAWQKVFIDWKGANLEGWYAQNLGNLAAYLDRTHDDLTTSICTFNLTMDKPYTIPDSVLLKLMMHHNPRNLRFSDCVNGLVLTQGGATQRVAFTDPRAINSVSPLIRQWLVPNTIVQADGMFPGMLISVDKTKAIADQFGIITQKQVDWSPDTVGPTENASLPVRMGGYLTFEGYVLIPDASGKIDQVPVSYRPGEQITLVTFWRADGDQIKGLRFFAHVLGNPNVEPLIQNDTISLNAGLLRDRDVFMQIIALPIPYDFQPGTYTLSVGAVNSQTEERLPVFDKDVPRGDRLILDQIVINAPPAK